MANRSFNRLQAIDKELKIIQGQFTVGASGAPTLVENKSVGVKSIAKSGTGDYALTLGVPNGDSDVYPHFYNAWFAYQKSTAHGGTVGAEFQIKSSTVDSDGVLNFFTLDKDGSAAHPADGATIHFTLVVKNSNLAGVGSGNV